MLAAATAGRSKTGHGSRHEAPWASDEEARGGIGVRPLSAGGRPRRKAMAQYTIPRGEVDRQEQQWMERRRLPEVEPLRQRSDRPQADEDPVFPTAPSAAAAATAAVNSINAMEKKGMTAPTAVSQGSRRLKDSADLLLRVQAMQVGGPRQLSDAGVTHRGP